MQRKTGAPSLEILPTFKNNFSKFVAGSKALFKSASEDTAMLVRPLSNRTRPLQQYGLTSYMPMIASKLAVTAELMSIIHIRLCQLHGPSANCSAAPAKLRIQPFKFSRFEPWSRLPNTKLLQKAADRRLEARTAGAHEIADPLLGARGAEAEANRPESFLVVCPRCNAVRNAARN